MTIDAGDLQRFHVGELGTITLVEVSPPTRLQRWGTRLAMAGWVLWGAGIVGGAIASNYGQGGWALVPLAIGGLLFVRGATAAARESHLTDRLKWRHEAVTGWHVAPELNGWTPETTEQLARARR